MRLEAQGLTKYYDKRPVVDGLSLFLDSGEVVGLLGPNGAGKTTTFYMLVGLLKPDSGTISLDGEDITELPLHKRAKRHITYLPQEPSVFRRLTVAENLLIVLEALGMDKKEREQRLQALLSELGLTPLAQKKAMTLSGGERRKLEITRSLINSPSFMLLDEPFAGIDPISVAELQRIIRGLKEKGIGVLITDHNVRETLNVCDRAYIINQGRVLVQGTPEEILKNNLARETYLGSHF